MRAWLASVAVGLSGYAVAFAIDRYFPAAALQPIILYHPVAVGILLGLAGVGVQAIPGGILGIVLGLALAIVLGPTEPPAAGDLMLAFAWLLVWGAMIAGGLLVGRLGRAGIRRLRRDR